MSRVLRVFNRTRHQVLGGCVSVADTTISRFVGLLGRRGIESSGGLLIHPSNGVHTVGMLFTIDVLLIDKNFRVIACYPMLRPYRLTRIYWKATSALELPAGMIAKTGTIVGDELSLEQV